MLRTSCRAHRAGKTEGKQDGKGYDVLLELFALRSSIGHIDRPVFAGDIEGRRSPDKRIASVGIDFGNQVLMLVMASYLKGLLERSEKRFQTLDVENMFRLEDNVPCGYIVLSLSDNLEGSKPVVAELGWQVICRLL